MEKIWIIGAGGIAIEYAKVLKALGREFIVIGRGEVSARTFEEATGVKPFIGGLSAFLRESPALPEKVINCVRAVDLMKINIELINYGVNCILCEKPGYLPSDSQNFTDIAIKSKCHIYIAYNRRFYASVMEAEKIIKDDGGLLSFNFEFTEWKHVFDAFPDWKKKELKDLFLGNSTHVVDLAFFIGGKPKDMTCYSNGTVGWHTPANYVGAGETEKGVLFNYCSNWNAPGRWSVEFLTAKHRIYLKPMEQLHLQDIASVKVYPVEIDDHLDKEFKPGFYLETKAFLEGDYSRMCSIEEQVENVENVYYRILGK